MPARRITRADLSYWPGDMVFHRGEAERKPGFVTAVTILPGGVAIYTISFCGDLFECYEFELTAEFIPDFGTEASE